MAKRNKKATRKIERLRDRLHHADENPDFKVGWITHYMFVMDNFDIGETKRANENRWLYTIGPQRRTRYPFETLVIPGTHYTLHWFMQCKISDPLQVPEFKYVPISTGSTTLPFGTAPYVPTVQISQTKSDWVLVPQEPFVSDAKVILQCLAKCLNQHNFTIFDARDLMHTLSIKLPLITQEETVCELEFLERQRKGIVIGYQNRYKRKASQIKLEAESPTKRPRLSQVTTGAATRLLLDFLGSNGSVSMSQAADHLSVKESLLEKIVEVLTVVGHVTVMDGVISPTSYMPSCSDLSVPHSCPPSPKSPLSSCDDSYGPIPETPPQSMPMWEATIVKDDPLALTINSSSSRPYVTRSSMRKKQEEEKDQRPVFSHIPGLLSNRPSSVHLHGTPFSVPPPTQPARPRQESSERNMWINNSNTTGDSGFGSSSLSLASDRYQPVKSDQLNFDTSLDLVDNTIVDFFQTSFWDQY